MADDLVTLIEAAIRQWKSGKLRSGDAMAAINEIVSAHNVADWKRLLRMTDPTAERSALVAWRTLIAAAREHVSDVDGYCVLDGETFPCLIVDLADALAQSQEQVRELEVDRKAWMRMALRTSDELAALQATMRRAGFEVSDV